MDKEKDNNNPKKALDLSTLRLDQNFAASLDGEKVTTTIPVRKPRKQEFVRTHPDKSYWLQLGAIQDEELGELYVVTSDLQQELTGEWRGVLLVATISRQGTLFLWPIKLASEEGHSNAWNDSSMQAAILAKEKWLRVRSNMSLQAYETYFMETTISEPIWSKLTIEEMIEIAFEGKIIDSLEHPFVQKLQGKV